MNQLFGILPDLGFGVHVELAIPHLRHILAFCDFSGWKFVFFENKTDPRAPNEAPPTSSRTPGLVPWTQPRKF